MPAPKASPPRGQISGARVVPLHIETAKKFGGGARGRTLALIYRQLCYWSKYAKWKGKNGKKMFYKSQRELADELGYSEKTINRAIKALRELGLVVVEQPITEASGALTEGSGAGSAGAGGAVHPAAKAAAASIRSKGGGGFGQNVRMQQREYKPLIKQSLQAVVERCNAIGKYLKEEQEGVVPIS